MSAPCSFRQSPHTGLRIGSASGKNDLRQAVKTAVINRQTGNAGPITGRKAFQRPMTEGVPLLNAVQDAHLDKDITVA
jgi:class I fructose-bisphosphate aldolase